MVVTSFIPPPFNYEHLSNSDIYEPRLYHWLAKVCWEVSQDLRALDFLYGKWDHILIIFPLEFCGIL